MRSLGACRKQHPESAEGDDAMQRVDLHAECLDVEALERAGRNEGYEEQTGPAGRRPRVSQRFRTLRAVSADELCIEQQRAVLDIELIESAACCAPR